MSELVSRDSELYSESGGVAAAISPGALIREARKASGVQVDVLAAALKITVDRLIALESDQYASLPDMTFARALASSACRYLRIDPTDVLALMPKNQAHNFPLGRSEFNVTFRDGSENKGRNSFSRQLTRPLGVAVIVLLVGAGVLFFLPERSNVPESVVSASVQKFAGGNVSESFALTQAMPASQEREGSTPFAPSASVAEAAADTHTSGAPTVEVMAAGAASVTAGGLLEFRAREATWIQVRDATKTVVLERTLIKGGSAFATGILPLSVVIGRADSTDVFVRGAPFALTPVAKENVARFEVK